MAPVMTRKIPHLSPREHQICKLVCLGRSNKAIGLVLKISPETVKEYLGQIFQRTACDGRTQLAVLYVQGASASRPDSRQPSNQERPPGERK
jgi:DNA-binding CsgD family transcriptional regulator